MTSQGDYPLNSKQKTIVEAPADQPQLVIAPPGTGKTHVVIGRINHLVQNLNLLPSEILVLCFTRTAVSEITKRLKHLVRNNQLHDDLRFISVRTFDSFATRMLLTTDHELEGFNDYDSRISLAIETLQSRNSDTSSLVAGFKHLIVDEVQDLVGIRSRFVQKIIERMKGGFTLLGDPAQAIYGFSNDGMETEEIMKWVRDQKWIDGVIERSLEENHRSSGKIASDVNKIRSAVLSKDLDDSEALRQITSFIKKLDNAGNGKLPDLPIITPDETLGVLCRSNGELLQLASFFIQNGIKFSIKPRPEDNGFPSWIGRVLGTYTDNTLSRSVFNKRWDDFVSSDQTHVDSAWNVLKRVEGRDEANLDMGVLNRHFRNGYRLPDDVDAYLGVGSDNISISTVHSVKGREFDKVVILQPGDMQEIQDYGNTLEEARVLYVAATRARKELAQMGREGLPRMWKMDCDGERSRWIASTHNGFNFIEIGCQGDVEPYSAISKYVYLQTEQAEEAQNYIWNNIHLGTKVNIVQTKRGHFKFYNIMSESLDGNNAMKLGQLSLSFKNDLGKSLDRLANGGRAYLPYHMDGIQVAAVVTNVIKPYEENIHDPYAKSGFCLGLRLRGMGFIYKRNGR